MAVLLDRLVSANDKVAAGVEAELRSVLSRINFADPVSAKAALFEVIPPLVEKWGDVAAVAAAEWFEEFRVAEGVSGAFRAQLAGPVPVGQINGRLGYATRESGHLFAGQDTDFEKFMSLIVNEYTMKPGHETVMYNSIRDKAAFARVPERGACKFCLMLASRGFVYSRSTADQSKDGERFHGSCRCHAMPVYDETRARVEYGYDEKALYEQYLAAPDA